MKTLTRALSTATAFTDSFAFAQADPAPVSMSPCFSACREDLRWNNEEVCVSTSPKKAPQHRIELINEIGFVINPLAKGKFDEPGGNVGGDFRYSVMFP